MTSFMGEIDLLRIYNVRAEHGPLKKEKNLSNYLRRFQLRQICQIWTLIALSIFLKIGLNYQ